MSTLFLISCDGDNDPPADTIPTITEINPVTGAVGAEVIITGKNFSATSSFNTVKFNTTVATVITASETELSVIVPAGAPPVKFL